MSIYKNQAQRVIDHMANQSGMSSDDYQRIFKITVHMIENRIELMHVQTKMNGKKCADAIIQSWEASHPDYLERQYNIVYQIDGLVFLIKQLPTELLIFLNGHKGEYLHSFKYSGDITEEVKQNACTDCLKVYNEKVKDL